MLTIDNVVVTVGAIVITGTVQVGGASIAVTLSLPSDQRFTLDQLDEIAGVVGSISAGDQARLDAIAQRTASETAALEALDKPPQT